MKKLIITIAACVLAISSVAARPTGLRVGGGYSMNFYNADKDGTSLLGLGLGLDNANFVGGFVEVGYDWAFNQHSTLCIGGRLNMLFNAKVSDNMALRDKDWSFTGQASNRSYLDIPVMYQFAFDLSDTVQMFIAAGPTLNLWLSNNTVFASASNISSKQSSDIDSNNWFKKNAYGENFYNRAGVSLGGQIGVYFHHVKIYAGYDQSLTGINGKDYGKSSLGQLRIGAAYVF